MRRSFNIRRFCAWLIGMTFLFSGLSKLTDPVGTSYIMKEYFHFFHLHFLDGAAGFLGICLSLLESFTGVLLVTGIFIHIALQVILNIGVVVALLPNTGVTLPFISYGGTSVLFLMAEMGVALSVARHIKIQQPALL